MRRFLMTSLALGLAAGCAGFGVSDTLDDVPELSEVSVSDEAVAIAASENAPGFFERFFSRDTTVTAAVPDTEEQAEEPEVADARPGLFGRLLGGGSANTDQGEAVPVSAPGTIAPLTNQAFGEVGTTCGLSTREMGTKIADVSGYTIYDTAPNTTAPRPHYITGFDDRCARQFTAALVLTGDVGTHEIVRYETAQSRRPYTQVDNAYEAIKASFCRAGFGKPCGSRINALARRTTFVTGYERFVSSPVWVEILLHDGEVAAVGVERK